MRDEWQPHDLGSFRATPTWISALQAAGIGVIAGLALYAIMSVVVLQAGDRSPAQTAPKECKKAAPEREVVLPPPTGTTLSSLRSKETPPL